jgi:hypothetical protein
MTVLVDLGQALQALDMKLTDALLIILTAAALALTWAITTYQWRLARRQNAIQLHSEYYSAEHYGTVVSPVAQMRLKWLHLPDGNERDQYRDVIAAGWAPSLLFTKGDSGSRFFKLYIHSDYPETDLVHSHYHVAIGSSGLSEHQALASMLHFWSRLAGLLDARAIDRKLARQFFAPAYEHNRKFFAGLRERVGKGYLEGDSYPAWIKHTELLDRFFA